MKLLSIPNNRRKRSTLLRRTTALAFLLLAPVIPAATLNFDDIPMDDSHTLGDSGVIPTPYNGLDFSRFLAFQGNTSDYAAHSGNTTLSDAYYNETISVPSGTFVFDEMWVKAFYNNSTPTFTVSGYNGSTLEYTIPVTIPLNFSGTAVNPWQLVSGNATPITRLVFDDTTAGLADYLIDDLKVSNLTTRSSVPDSGGMPTLMAIAAIALLCAARMANQPVRI